MADQIRYDLLTQQALRGVVRNVLADAAKKGLPGEHHFYIAFDTRADGVRISDRLRAQYPEEMTIILQHQFWDLKVTDHGFEVGLSFGGIPEKLRCRSRPSTASSIRRCSSACNSRKSPKGEEAQPAPTIDPGQGRRTKKPRRASLPRIRRPPRPKRQPRKLRPRPSRSRTSRRRRRRSRAPRPLP